MAHKSQVIAFANIFLSDDDFVPAKKKDIVTRMLRNLFHVAELEEDQSGMLAYLDAMLAVNADSAPDRGMRAMIYYGQGRIKEAIEDIDWILDNEPEGVDVEGLRELRDRWNEIEEE